MTHNQRPLHNRTYIQYLVNKEYFSELYHRRLLLKLDTQPRSHLLVEFCILQGICTAPHPLQCGTPPLLC